MIAVRFVDAAEEEFLAEVDRYAEVSPTLSSGLIEAVESALSRIAAFPKHGSPYESGTRRVVLQGFRYQLIYRVADEEAWIVAFAHHSRRPGYWRDRI